MDIGTIISLATAGGGFLAYLIGLTVKGSSAISSLRVELAQATTANEAQAKELATLRDRVEKVEGEQIRAEGYRKSIAGSVETTAQLITQRLDNFGDKLSGIASTQKTLADDLRRHMSAEERHARAIELRLTKVLQRAGLEARLDGD